MKLDRMELADLANPEKLAAAIVKQLPGLSYPVPVDDIAKALDITDIQELTSEGFEGALLTNDAKGDGVILVKHGPLERQRFTIGHELGHFLSPHHLPSEDGFKCTSRDMRATESAAAGRPEWEVEANRFAAELLMPPALFKQALKARKVLDLDHIIEMANRFRVSKLAGARRVVDLSGDTCAIVVSKEDTVVFSHRSKEFPFISLRHGMELPRGSLSRSFTGEGERISSFDESEASLWTNSARKGTVMYEQVIAQAKGYKLTFLLNEQADPDEYDDERDEELERRQRFKW